MNLDCATPSVAQCTGMRKIKFFPGEYYHVYNRGNQKRNIFLDKSDYARFIFLLLFFQAPVPIDNISRQIKYFVQHSVFNIKNTTIDSIAEKREVELVSFTLMPNHFHTLLLEVKEGGISRYMQRVLDAYTKYFNAKYEVNGHLFQGPFQAVYVETNEQLLHLSAYIHRNVHELSKWKGKELQYPWSSYQDYVVKNRWEKLLRTQRVLEQFSSANEYKKHVEESGIKDENNI